MVGVAQLAERRAVAAKVGSSSLLAHPAIQKTPFKKAFLF